MDRLDFLNLVMVWLVANMAIVTYLAFLYSANRVSDLFNAVNSRSGDPALEGKKAQVVMINTSHSLYQRRGC
jgi:hypothetical protein